MSDEAGKKPKVYKIAGTWVWTCCDDQVGAFYPVATWNFGPSLLAWGAAVSIAIKHHMLYHDPNPGEEIDPLGGEETRRV